MYSWRQLLHSTFPCVFFFIVPIGRACGAWKTCEKRAEEQLCRAKAKVITSIFGHFWFFVSIDGVFEGASNEPCHGKILVKEKEIFWKYVFGNYYVFTLWSSFKGKYDHVILCVKNDHVGGCAEQSEWQKWLRLKRNQFCPNIGEQYAWRKRLRTDVVIAALKFRFLKMAKTTTFGRNRFWARDEEIRDASN